MGDKFIRILANEILFSNIISQFGAIIFIAALGINLPEDIYREETLQSLVNNGIEYDGFYFAVHDKAKLAKELKIDIAFEDAPYQYDALHDVCGTFIIEADCNTEVPFSHRIPNLYEAVAKVVELDHKDAIINKAQAI